MFSNINEAWGSDPVKEMTEKLSKGAFQTHNGHSNIYNFKNQNNSLNNKKTNPPLQDIVSLSDNSINLLSETTSDYQKKDAVKGFLEASDYGSYAPVHFSRLPKKNKLRSSKQPSITSLNFSDTTDSNFLESVDDSRCSYSVKHLKKCDRCYYKLKRLIDNKVNKKIDDILLDTKMRQLQNAALIQQPIAQSQSTGGTTSDSWKETLIIIVGAIIAIFIIFLIFKCLNKQ